MGEHRRDMAKTSDRNRQDLPILGYLQQLNFLLKKKPKYILLY